MGLNGIFERGCYVEFVRIFCTPFVNNFTLGNFTYEEIRGDSVASLQCLRNLLMKAFALQSATAHLHIPSSRTWPALIMP